jgi:histidine phosphotransferase ChpT
VQKIDDFELAALLCSRLCHDLIGPVGAIGNGLEVLEDEKDASMREQAMELIGQSAEQAARKLRFYRLAFGAATGGGADLAEARRAAEELFAESKVRLAWPADAAPLERPQLKLLLNLVLAGAEALPRGGDLAVSPLALAVEARGQNARLSEAAEAALRGGGEAAQAKVAPVLLAAKLAQRLGRTIEVERATDRVRLAAARS